MVTQIRQAIEINSQTIKVPNRRKIVKPWITPGLLRCVRHRDSLHKKSRKTPDNDNLKLIFTRYRNFCNKLLNKIKTEYEKNEITKAGTNPKNLWTAINNLTNRSKKKVAASHLLSLSSSPKESVNLANDYFAQIGKQLAKKIVSPSKAAKLYVNNNAHSMVLLPTDEKEVEQLLMSLRSDCALGWDKISSNLLKRNKNSIVPPLTYIYNRQIP